MSMSKRRILARRANNYLKRVAEIKKREAIKRSKRKQRKRRCTDA